MQHQVTIPLRYLKAARLFASKKDVRFYLMGVALKDGHAVGTDGHKCGAIRCRELDPLPEVTIPNDAIDLFVKMMGRTTFDQLTVEWSEKEGRLSCGPAELKFTPIDGRFPDFKRALAYHTEPGASAQFDWSHLVQFEKAAEELGTSKKKPGKAILLPNGQACARVVLPGHLDFIGGVMPLREKEYLETLAALEAEDLV